MNGRDVELDVPAKVVNGSTLVPVRFIAESLGAEVLWDQESKTVLVNSTILKEVKPTYKVTRVVDGDTIIVSLNGIEERVRLIGVDTQKVYILMFLRICQKVKRHQHLLSQSLRVKM